MKPIKGSFFLIYTFILFGYIPAYAQKSRLLELEKRLNADTKDTSLVNLLNDLAFEYYSPNPVKSKELADRAFFLAEEIDYKKGIATSYRNIGNFYWTQGDYDKALENNFKSLRMFEDLGNSREIARTYNSIALVYRDLNNYNSALTYFYKSFDLFSSEKDQERIGILLNNIGGVYIRQGKPREALVNLLKANKIFKELNDQSRLGTNLNNIGYLFLKERNPKGALDYLRKAYKIDSIANDKGRMALNLNGIAQAFRIKRDFKKAIQTHNQALVIAREIGLKEEVKNAYKGLATSYSENGQFEEAYRYHEMFHNIYDSLFNEKSNNRKRQIEALFESEGKQAEIDLLVKNRQLQDTQLQKEKLINNSLIGAFIALTIIAFILFRGISQKQKINKQLREQKREIQRKNEDLMHKNLEITQQKDEISAQTVDIKNKTKELEEALEKINKQKEALMQLNATKDKFFSIVAHDIKSPLDSLSAFATLLANYIDNMSKDEIKIIATNLDQSVKNTLQLTENLLTWARSQMNNLNFSPTTVSLSEVVEQKLGLFKLIAANKKIEIKTEFNPDLMLFADENHLRFILRNLISNSLKFTMPNGVVVIKCEDKGEFAEISVTDDGVGISPEILPKIFRIDTKISTRGTAGEKGTGLGLLLCKEFVERNGGEIKVESEVAKGTKFSFTIKKAEVFAMNA